MKNLFVSTTFIKDEGNFLDAVKKLKLLKITNIEIGSNHKFFKGKINLKKLNCNFIIHNYFPVPKKSIIINIASPEESIRKASVKKIKQSIKFTKQNNAKLYTFHPGFVIDPKSTSQKKSNLDFIWDKRKKNISKKLAWKQMIKSLKEIISFSKKFNLPICVETQGSIKQVDKLLLQHPNEFRDLKDLFKNKNFGINLNIGHLNLASKALNFDKYKFVNQIKKKIFAIEASHNFGKIDNHLPLKKKAWYWSILKDRYFSNIPIILEFRNCNLNEIKKNYKLIYNEKIN